MPAVPMLFFKPPSVADRSRRRRSVLPGGLPARWSTRPRSASSSAAGSASADAAEAERGDRRLHLRQRRHRRDLQKTDGAVGPGQGVRHLLPGRSATWRNGLDWRNLEVIGRVNGEERQRGDATDMLFSIPELLVVHQRHHDARAGRPGRDRHRRPELHRCRHGDVVEVEIPGVGVLSNPVRNGRPR